MKTIELTKFESKLILQGLDPDSICSHGCCCYMNYNKKVSCDDKDENGNPVCEMLKAIESIDRKLGGYGLYD